MFGFFAFGLFVFGLSVFGLLVFGFFAAIDLPLADLMDIEMTVPVISSDSIPPQQSLRLFEPMDE